MLYLALPPVPPPIVITLPPENNTGETTTKTISSSEKLTKTSTQDSGIASAAKAQPLLCQSSQTQLSTQKSHQVDDLLRKISAQSQGKAVDCIPQGKNSGISSLQSRLRKHKSAKGFAPITTAPTSLKSSLTINQERATDYMNTASHEQADKQQPNNTLAFDKSAEKNTIRKILGTVQELINFSLSASLKSTIDLAAKANTQNPLPIADSRIQPISTPQSSSGNEQAVAAASTNPIDKVNPANTGSNETSSSHKLTNALNQISQKDAVGKILAAVQQLINLSLSGSLQNSNQNSQKIAASTLEQISTSTQNGTINNEKEAPQGNHSPSAIELARTPGEPFLVGVMINGREVGTLDIIQENNTLLIPLESFATLARITLETTDGSVQAKTPLGVIKLQPNSLKQINGITYITQSALKEDLRINLELNTADLTLLADLPWQGDSSQYQAPVVQLIPDFLAPGTVFSTFKQELDLVNSGGDTSIRSSTLLGGRLAGGLWRVRLDNNFEDRPDISEYFFYKRSGQFRYQIGQQILGLHPLLSGVNLTGLQFGYSNLPNEYFENVNYGASELLPRRSRPLQTLRGQVPPASFIQLRVGGVVIAQQQVGFNGIYEFIDINLPVGQNNEIEILIFDRNNLRIPSEIRSVRINPSDLLLPAGGNVQLAGLGFSGNLAQNLIDTNSALDSGKFVGFYQLRQGLSNNLTLEGSVQAVPDAVQTQAGLVWRLANPVVLSASVGTSGDKVGYSTDLNVQLNRLDINANSQSLPQGYRPSKNKQEIYNHSLEVKYRFSNKYNLGFIARSRQDEGSSASYILPTFSARPFSTLSLNGRPDIDGRYLFSAFYQPSDSTRLSFNAYGDAYISDLSYKFGRDYQVSFGTEFGGDASPRYSVGFGRYPSSLDKLSWNLGLAYSDGEVGPVVGASMRVLPGLFARVEYQGIPSRAKGIFGGGDDRLSVSLVSDLSFANGRVTPASYSGIGKEQGGIAGRLVVEGDRKNYDLSGTVVRILDNRSRSVGSAKTDSKGNFFVGNLREGLYVVQLEPEELPVELSLMKSSAVAQVASSAVTGVDFPVRPEFGVAGRITDIAGQPVEKVSVELINGAGARVLSAMTDSFGLYRLDGVPVGFYTLRVSTQDSLNPNDTLPKREIQIRNQFVYDQNLQLPISAAAKKK